MSSDRETTQIVRSWLEEGVTVLPDRVLDSVLDQVPRTPQRRSLWGWLTNGNLGASAKLAMTAAAIVIVAVLGVELVPAISGLFGPASPSRSPSPTPTGVPSPSAEGALSPGQHSLQSFAVPGITYEVPAGWSLCSDSPDEANLCSDRELGVSFVIVQNVVAGACASAFELQSPPIGPSVDELVAAISSLPGVTVTPAVDVSIDGFQGKALTVSAAVPPTCAVYTWASSLHTNGMGADEANIVRIVDVNGTRLLIAGAYPRVGPDAGTAAALVQQILDSIHIAR
jgi:hypothetical protein